MAKAGEVYTAAVVVESLYRVSFTIERDQDNPWEVARQVAELAHISRDAPEQVHYDVEDVVRIAEEAA